MADKHTDSTEHGNDQHKQPHTTATKTALDGKLDGLTGRARSIAVGTKNLIPCSKRSKDEARKLGYKGGINSGKARRRAKNLRELAKAILDLPVDDAKKRDALKAMGLEGKEKDSLIKDMIKTSHHNANMTRLLLELTGDLEQQQTNVNVQISSMSDEQLNDSIAKMKSAYKCINVTPKPPELGD